jgi:hypothetical protein
MKKLKQHTMLKYSLYISLALALGALSAWAYYRPTRSVEISTAGQTARFVAQAAQEEAQPTANPDVDEARKQFKPQTVVANGLAVQTNYARILAPGEHELQQGIEIGYCYPTRNAGQWYFTFEPIEINGRKIIPWSFDWQRDKAIPANSEKPGRECGVVIYEVDPATIQLPLQFTISSIFVIPHEGTFCQELKLRLESSSEAKRVGLSAHCEDLADGSYQARVRSHAPNVSAETAQQVLDAEIASEYVGPWTFSIEGFEP